jgi:NAD-dependent dihydropyrimidine dehydrogenase PreA subunit
MNAAGVLRVLVADGGRAARLPAAERLSLVRTLLDRGCAVSCAPVDQPGGDVDLVIGRFGGAPPPAAPGVAIEDLDARGTPGTPGTADGEAHDLSAVVGGARDARGLAGAAPWKPWFPVIDYQRCTNCMQCLSFCLFDVYAVSAEGLIQVQNQSNCKTDCPACSRVCPEVAIMFPKYRHGPINGEEVSADDVRREAMKVDISALLGGDIYAALRDRSAKAKSRFSKERDDERALKERQTCLVKLQQSLDIPAEVLAALPSPDEIRAKADALKARVQQATAKPETA